MNRAERLCDSEKKQHIHKVLHNNYYPTQSINIENKQRNNNVPATNKDTQQMYIFAPYKQRTSERVITIFKKYDVYIAQTY